MAGGEEWGTSVRHPSGSEAAILPRGCPAVGADLPSSLPSMPLRPGTSAPWLCAVQPAGWARGRQPAGLPRPLCLCTELRVVTVGPHTHALG